MKLQAFTFPDVLIRYIAFYIVTTYDIKYFSIDLTSLVIPGFSVLCYAIIHEVENMLNTCLFCHSLQEVSWRSVISSLRSLPLSPWSWGRKPWSSHTPGTPCGRRRRHFSLPLVPMEVLFSLADLLTGSWMKETLHFRVKVIPPILEGIIESSGWKGTLKGCLIQPSCSEHRKGKEAKM